MRNHYDCLCVRLASNPNQDRRIGYAHHCATVEELVTMRLADYVSILERRYIKM